MNVPSSFRAGRAVLVELQDFDFDALAARTGSARFGLSDGLRLAEQPDDVRRRVATSSAARSISNVSGSAAFSIRRSSAVVISVPASTSTSPVSWSTIGAASSLAFQFAPADGVLAFGRGDREQVQGAQQGRDRELARLADAHGDGVGGVGLHIHPGAFAAG